MKFGLRNTTELLSRLNNPHHFFRSIHVAGTNGKGSTSAMIDTILRRTGLKTGLFTSPHMVRFTERIRVNGEEIDESDVVRITNEIINIIPQEIKPTFFEFITAIAFKYFMEQSVDAGVIEVGMGGRLDATNVIMPDVTVITRIGYDHKEFLGNTIEEIAGEKAGIIKKGIPVVTANQIKGAMDVIEKRAKESSSQIHIYGRDFYGELREVTTEGLSFEYYDLELEKSLSPFIVNIPLTGEYQVENCSLAIKASLIFIERLRGLRRDLYKDFNHLKEMIQDGLRNLNWKGRLELIRWNKNGMIKNIILDGAHNPQAMEELKKQLKNIYLRLYKRIILVLGVMADKDVDGIISALLEVSDIIITTSPQYSRAMEPLKLQKKIEVISSLSSFQRKVFSQDTVNMALDMALDMAKEDDLVVVTGSFYTVGEAKIYFGEKESLKELRESFHEEKKSEQRV